MTEKEKTPFKKLPFSLQMDLSKFELATDAEKAQQDIMRESTTFFKDGMRRLRKNYLAMASLIVLALIILLISIAPMFIPYGYEEVIRVNGKRDRTLVNMKPFTWSDKEQEAIDAGEKLFPHIMGTDDLGRDYFVRVLYGTRVSLIVGLFASLIVLIIGLLYGSISGFGRH